MPPDPDDRNSREYTSWLDQIRRADDEDDVFAALAAKRPPSSKLARQQLRGRLVGVLTQKFKALEVATSPARTADAWLQEGGLEEGEDGLQGQAFTAEETEPWANPVDGAELLDEVTAVFASYLHAPSHVLDAVALWSVYTHLYECFGVSPLLDFSSPTKRCGKSTGVVVARHLCRSPLLSGNITPAALFRAIEAWKPTLLIDEADTFAAMHDDLRGILNAGHTRDTAFVIRAEGDANEPRVFSTWAPKLVAAIGRLPDTIEDRSIRCVLSRKPTNVSKLDAFDGPAVRKVCLPVRQRVARFALDNLDLVASAVVERPDGLHDRAWNNWRPLFAVAAAAGDGWPERAAAAALTLSNEDDVEEDIGTLTLQMVWDLLKEAERASTHDVLVHLVEQDEGPFSKWWEKDLANNQLRRPSAKLASLLKRFKIKPKQLWVDGANVRGYDAADFASDHVAPYLEKDARDAEDARNGSQSQAGSSVLSVPSVFSEGAREGNGRPLLGDEMYPVMLANAVRDGHLTELEAEQQLALHRLAAEASE